MTGRTTTRSLGPVVRVLAASPGEVRAAALAPIRTGFADPGEGAAEGDGVAWRATGDIVERADYRALIEPDARGARLTLSAEYAFALPYFGLAFRPLVRASVAKSLAAIAGAIEARVEGREPPAPRRPVWAPPDAMSAAQAAVIATVFAVVAVVSYAGSLFTQALDYVARTFGASNADLGVVLAASRAGTVVGLVGSALADRIGRRRILMTATGATILFSFVSAFAPSLAALGGAQVLARGFLNLAAVVAFIVITEEASEGSRAYMLALGSIAGGAGFALGAVLLPLADVHEQAWRALFALNALGLLLLPGIARRLPESRRYAAMAARARTARARELLDATYGRRFALVAFTGFLLAVFATPAVQFTNRYLADERGYSAAGILLLRVVTQSGTALVAAWVGGRLAESAGRRPVAAYGTLVMASATALFFLGDGAWLWVMLLVGTTAGAVSGPALGAFNTEMFPTEVRGRAGAALLVAGVAGSVVGLLSAGLLADRLGGIGPAVAVTAVAPIAAAALLVPRLPEARGVPLDVLSPPEV